MRQTIQFVKENYGSFTFNCKQLEARFVVDFYSQILHRAVRPARLFVYTFQFRHKPRHLLLDRHTGACQHSFFPHIISQIKGIAYFMRFLAV